MDYSERFDIYVTENVAKTLNDDALLFEFFKKDGITINHNRFLTRLISGYFD